MLTCYICKVQHRNCSTLFQHLKFSHALYPGHKLRLKCGEHGCSSVFYTYSGFKKHLLKAHGDTFATDSVYKGNVGTDSVETDDVSAHDPLSSSSVGQQSHAKKKQLMDMCSSVIAQVQAAGVSENIVQSLTCSMEEVVNDVHIQAQDAVLKCLSSEVNEQTLNKVRECFENIENPFTHLNTERKRQKYLEKKWKIVEPVEHVLGVRYDTRLDKTTGVYSQIPVNDKFMYVPILGTLDSLFTNQELSTCFQQVKCHEDGIYRDINDGSYLRNHSLFSEQEHALQIQLYYDDFETANPLGPKRGSHKLGCIYFILRNLPAKLNSVLMNIHLVSLFHAEDLKKYGFGPVLQPLVNDLKCLETEGIKVPFSDTPLRGSIVQVTGDNLALHSLFGLVESFSATYCCRFCLTDKTKLQSVFSEDDQDLTFRTKELYSEHFNAVAQNPILVHSFGVKRECPLNALQYFHCSNNYAVDIMHDLLEGVVQYELQLLFQYMVRTSIDLNTLSERIQSFNYGYLERNNRPSAVKIDGSNDLGLNAIQSWCLLRNTPLIFEDIINRNNSYWRVILLLIQIVNIVFSPKITDGMTYFLKHLISDHHKLFKSVFTDKKLIPKHHLMIHYPRCIRKIGPLIHVWCMRFEGKHNFFKKSVKNFKNITKTLVKKHQRQLAFHWENFYFQRFQFGPLKDYPISELDFSEVLRSCPRLNVPCVSTASWVKNFGTEYHIGMIVCTSTENEMPVFQKIVNIIVKDDFF
ncbi:uncharacterized protein LOC115791568 [Archocentrus centrarchus]|uniref:uncharacterized protein LOC115791568 n=1 Tax=Archocentrus centrarchus TaxID=63155 RepID=UPI0011EA1968|nr:uncharacterized protein LOC115791568 [Archocentrus centrarchus]